MSNEEEGKKDLKPDVVPLQTTGCSHQAQDRQEHADQSERETAEVDDHMAQWSRALHQIEGMIGPQRQGALSSSTRTLADSILSRSLDNLRAIKRMVDLLTEGSTKDVCRLAECPRADVLTSGIKNAIDVIDRTRRAFKSKDLAELRVTLERLLAEAEQ